MNRITDVSVIKIHFKDLSQNPYEGKLYLAIFHFSKNLENYQRICEMIAHSFSMNLTVYSKQVCMPHELNFQMIDSAKICS